jgi:hypothetical protein
MLTQRGRRRKASPDHLVDEISPSKNQHGDLGSVKTFRGECIEIMDEDDNKLNATPAKDLQRSPSPNSLTVQTDSAAQATSTLTEDTTTVNIATSLEQMTLKHPQLAQSLWTKNSAVLSRPPQLHDNSKSTAVSPNEGVDGSL